MPPGCRGDAALARRRWERSIALEPRRSWKPYVELALAGDDAGEESRGSYWSQAEGGLPFRAASAERDGALAAYAAELAAGGPRKEALRALAGGGSSRAGRGEARPGRDDSGRQPERGQARRRPREPGGRERRRRCVIGAVAARPPRRGSTGSSHILRQAIGKKRASPSSTAGTTTRPCRGSRGDFKASARRSGSAAWSGGPRRGPPGRCGGRLRARQPLRRDGRTGARRRGFRASGGLEARGGRERCAALQGAGPSVGRFRRPRGAAAAVQVGRRRPTPPMPEAAVLARGASGKIGRDREEAIDQTQERRAAGRHAQVLRDALGALRAHRPDGQGGRQHGGAGRGDAGFIEARGARSWFLGYGGLSRQYLRLGERGSHPRHTRASAD